MVKSIDKKKYFPHKNAYRNFRIIVILSIIFFTFLAYFNPLGSQKGFFYYLLFSIIIGLFLLIFLISFFVFSVAKKRQPIIEISTKELMLSFPFFDTKKSLSQSDIKEIVVQKKGFSESIIIKLKYSDLLKDISFAKDPKNDSNLLLVKPFYSKDFNSLYKDLKKFISKNK